MKYRDIVKKLRKEGWIITHGGNHDLAVHPNRPGKIPIPRDKDINEYTAKGILKDAGVK